MKSIKILSYLFILLFITGCSNSAISPSHINSATSNAIYYQSTFPKTEFNPVNSHTIKKPLSSDYQLLLSLLNRPIPEDQAMMLAFTQQGSSKMHQNSARSVFVNYVNIKGNKENEKSSIKNQNDYSSLMAKDINSISITGSL